MICVNKKGQKHLLAATIGSKRKYLNLQLFMRPNLHIV